MQNGAGGKGVKSTGSIGAMLPHCQLGINELFVGSFDLQVLAIGALTGRGGGALSVGKPEALLGVPC